MTAQEICMSVSKHQLAGDGTPSGERKVIASHWQGKELNSPNDVVVRSDNMVYFSVHSYGRMPVFGLERKQD